jgi:hypothetical protein
VREVYTTYSIREEIISGGFFWTGTPVALAQTWRSKSYENDRLGGEVSSYGWLCDYGDWDWGVLLWVLST